jgi:membrane protein
MSCTKVRLREAWNWGGLSAKELAKRTWEQMSQHDTLDRAAVVAFYAMLGLIPVLGIVLAISLGVGPKVAEQILKWSHEFLPAEGAKLIEDQISQVRSSPPTGVLSFGFLVLLWSASSLFTAVMDGTNAAYALHDSRPWWKRQLISIALTVAEAVLFLGAALLILLWPKITGWLELGIATTVIAAVVQWVVVLILLLASFSLAYYFTPDVDQQWEWITPGSTLGVILMILLTLGFRLYVQYGSTYNATYGALAGVIITLLWFYLAALALLTGGRGQQRYRARRPTRQGTGRKRNPLRAGGRLRDGYGGSGSSSGSPSSSSLGHSSMETASGSIPRSRSFTSTAAALSRYGLVRKTS